VDKHGASDRRGRYWIMSPTIGVDEKRSEMRLNHPFFHHRILNDSDCSILMSERYKKDLADGIFDITCQLAPVIIK